MLIMTAFFLLPLMMVLVGILTYNDNPQIDSKTGYRTEKTLKDNFVFAFANKLIYEYFIRFNCLSLITTLALVLLYQTYYFDLTYLHQFLFFGFLGFVQIISCVLPFYFVEQKLSKNFNFEDDDSEITFRRNFFEYRETID